MKRVGLIKMLRTNSVFLVVPLLLGRKIFEAFQNSSLKQQRVKTGTYEKLNEALLKWFTSMRGNNIPINGPILLEKAHEFAKAFNQNDFAASNGWLRGWKER